LIRQDQSTGYAATYLPDTPEMIIPPTFIQVMKMAPIQAQLAE